MTGVLVLLGAVLLTLAGGLVHRRGDGRLRVDSAPAPSLSAPSLSAPAASAPALSALTRLGASPGERATLLQFSSAFCAPCRATRRTLADIAGVVPGVVHVEVDAEQHLDLVRSLDVRRTPTTLVLDAAGVETVRASGQPTKAAVLAALGQALA